MMRWFLLEVTALAVSAEHMEANLLPCNAAVRLQARALRWQDARK